ncbi:hypothetical protein FRC06_006116 [Ceratobasidium sp. 370]|nr:hypothetical protein FRC06_006116 [Ceratobasidium sp. 370]
MKPSDFDRFSKRTEDTPTALNLGDWPTRSAAPSYDDQIEVSPALIQEGSRVFSRGRFVSDRAFTRDLIRCGNTMLEQIIARGLKDITLFLRKREDGIEHYVADHAAETITWANNQRPESLCGLSRDQERNILKEEYWTHMENFPGARRVNGANIEHLKDVLASLAIGMSLILCPVLL